MLRTILKSSLVVGLLGTTGLTANAEIEFSGNVAFTTDYVWRGVSQTDQGFAVQGGFDVSASNGFYAGTWASNVQFGDDDRTSAELDLYGGYAGEFGNGFSYDVGVIQYLYTGAASDADLDFLEVYGGLSYSLDAGLDLGLFAAYDPDNKNTYIEGSAGYSITDDLGVSLAVGNYSFDGDGDYTQTTIGGSYTVNDLFDIGLAYYTTDIDEVEDGISISLSKSL